MSLKERFSCISLVRDYYSFFSIYYECTSRTKFLRNRWIPNFPKNIYWPVHQRSEVRGNILIGKGARVGHRPGCVIQGRGVVFIGDYVEIGPNCMVISGNHDLYNQNDVVRRETIIGDYCWLASSCIILAGVVLGPRTIVAAGSVVTKSFSEGYCIVAGNPAKIIRRLEKEKFVCECPEIEYYGYIREDKFLDYYKKHLSHIKVSMDLKKVTNDKLLIQCLNTQL